MLPFIYDGIRRQAIVFISIVVKRDLTSTWCLIKIFDLDRLPQLTAFYSPPRAFKSKQQIRESITARE